MWISFALSGAVFVALNSLFYKFLANRGEPASSTICIFKLVSSICCLVPFFGGVDFAAVTKAQWGWLVLLGVLSNVGDFAQLDAIRTGPNPGYVQAIIQLQAVVILVLSCVLLGMCGTVTYLQIAGVLLSIGGACLICLPERTP